MHYNSVVIILNGLIPLIIGFLWYNDSLFGKAWKKHSGVNLDPNVKMNMPLIFGLTFVFGCFLSFMMTALTIHQQGLFSMVMNHPDLADPNSALNNTLNDMMSKYGDNYRTFKHGALHGVLSALFFATPVLAINAMFERKNATYILINVGYWVVVCGLMGGIVCAFA